MNGRSISESALLRMDRSTRSLYCLILLGSMATCFALFDPYYRPDPSCSVFRPPIGQDGIRLPPTKRIITYREFDDKVSKKIISNFT